MVYILMYTYIYDILNTTINEYQHKEDGRIYLFEYILGTLLGQITSSETKKKLLRVFRHSVVRNYYD